MNHTFAMKMTLNVDEDSLKKVMKLLGTTNKTHAINTALRDTARKLTLTSILQRGTGLSGDALKSAYATEEEYDFMAMRLAEDPVKYGRKPRSRG